MRKLITSNIIPADHPINGLSRKLKIKYLRGLGEVLCMIEPGTQTAHKAKLCYDSLSMHFLGEKFEEGWEQPGNYKHIRQAQSLNRNGFSFFRMSDCFWWDAYRIAYQSGLPISHETYDDSLKKMTGLFTHKFRKAAKNHFFGEGEGDCDVLPEILTHQSTMEQAFHNRPAKKILIVGTMSAGKSTLVNALVGRKTAKVKTTVCTNSISYICNNPFSDTLLYSDGTNLIISSDSEVAKEENIPNKAVKFIGALDSQPVVVIDTPGVDYAYDLTHKKITYDAIEHEDYDLLICVNNGPYIERNGENELINHVLKKKNKKTIFVLNQLDKFDPADDSIEESIEQFKNILLKKKSEANIIPFSARTAFLLKKELTSKLSKFEETELKLLKDRMSSSFYDLGMYGTGVCSKEDDFFAKSGLTNLETIIINL